MSSRSLSFASAGLSSASLLLLATICTAQYPAYTNLPRDQNEADMLQRDIEARPLPADPNLAYDDSKEARQYVETYRSIQNQVPQTLQSFDTNKKQFHETILALRNLGKDPKKCASKETQD